jgi:hypothetical protein
MVEMLDRVYEWIFPIALTVIGITVFYALLFG